MELARFDRDAFLRDHWQKQPLLIRNPWTRWRNPLDGDELAGLACEEGIESRLIVHGAGGLTLESGPFAEDRFAGLGAAPWTLLVQAVDHHVPDVADLIAPFRFVPDWRIDDVMVSYAVDGGGVGPHYDQYDVFLIQGQGRRRWRVGPVCDADTPLLPHADLRLIEDFAATGDWVLEPGDILYVPPRFAHDGVALGDDCMTYSIGFRAPSCAELVEGWAARVADGLAEDDRYADPDLAQQAHPGEILPGAIERAHAMALAALSDRAAFARWFGEQVSAPKYPEADWRPERPVNARQVKAHLARGGGLLKNPASRFAFLRDGLLFVDGEAYACAPPVAEALCSPVPDAAGADVALLVALINRGALALDED